MSDRDDEVERICQAALDLPHAERSAFLAEACAGDSALCGEIESLLTLEGCAHAFIEMPAALMPTLTPQSRFAHYEIRSTIGVGGMGEVYHAHDTTLARDVALKVLPPAFAINADRIRRFEREAKVLASLNHPNIAVIHGVERVGTIRALVLELVEGPTLADRIARGPIPIEEALAIALQIADALEAAHARGIVHRDLKPANVKVRTDGTVKVLDFGLSKIVDGPAAAARTPGSQVEAGSVPGLLLGTPAYMAPELLKGGTPHRRGDVWAFGCVLFEMLAGRAAFEGDTSSELIAEILTREADSERLPTATPESVRRLLRRCLAKDPRHRLHDMADVRIELEEASGSPSPVVDPLHNGLFSRTLLVWISTVAALVLGLLAVTAWVMNPAWSRAAPPEMRLELVTPPTMDPTSVAISPDGRHVVYVGTVDRRSRLLLRTLDGSPARPLPGTDFAAYPFWSPDGRSIGFFADLRLKRLDLDGGTVQPLARIEVGLGATWTADGAIYFGSGPARPLFRIADKGGDVVPVTRVRPPQTGHRYPHALPDGRHILYYVTGASEISGVYVARRDGSNAQRLFAADSAATYAASGHLIFARQSTLYAVRFDVATLEISGNPFSIAENVATDGSLGVPPAATSAMGHILYRQSSTGGKLQFIWFARDGSELSRLGDASNTVPAHPSLSHAGDRLAFTGAHGGNPDVWLMDVKDGRTAKLTLDQSTEIYPIWSPAGTRVIFGSNRRGRGGLELYQKSTTSQSEASLIALDEMSTVMPEHWSPDGRFILFRGLRNANASFDIWALPLDAPEGAFPVVQTEFEERDGQFSPDGQWIAYHSDESGRFEVYVQPFMRPGARTTISVAGGTQVRWSDNFKELFYIAPDSRLMAVPIRVSPDRQAMTAGLAKPLFDTRTWGGLPGQGNYRQQYVVSPDGQRFLVQSIVSEETAPITVVLNWRGKW